MRQTLRKPAYSAREVLLLSAPHTWVASVMPALLSAALAYADTGKADPLMSLWVLLACILMQSAANAFNDYADYLKGTDSAENSPDKNDAVIVYGMPPRAALNWGIAFLLAAASLGAYISAAKGIVPLLIGLAGGAAIVWYTFGNRPASYLPVGELLSGFVMGGLIPLAGYYAQTERLAPGVLLDSLPQCLGIALIMLTNNSCDIERDKKSGRRTLACLLGAGKALILYRAMLVLWAVSPVLVLLFRGGRAGPAVCVAGLAIAARPLAGQLSLTPGQNIRPRAMRGIVRLNVFQSIGYMLAILAEVWL